MSERREEPKKECNNSVEDQEDSASLSNDEQDEQDEDNERIPIDLSENEVYRGICTLFEDEDGNNILEYVSLLHTELIGINKSLENLKNIKKDIGRIADCAELFLKSQKSESLDDHKKIKKVSKQ